MGGTEERQTPGLTARRFSLPAPTLRTVADTPGEPARPSEASPLLPPDGFEMVPVRARDILLGSGPRFARDAFGPMVLFYGGWKVGGLALGIALATVAAVLAFLYERRRDRSGLMVRIGLVLVVLQAVVGLVADSERVYLAQPVLITGVYGLVFCVSAAIGRPLAGAFAGEMYPFPPEVKASQTYRSAFCRISLVWGVYLLIRSGVRLATLSTGSVESFLAINFVTGVPLTALLMSWSVWYGVRFFRRSAEWGPALALLEGHPRDSRRGKCNGCSS